MSIKPILFNTEMVQAILKGQKTVTRRIIKPQPENVRASLGWSDVKRTYEFVCSGGTGKMEFDCHYFCRPPYLAGDVLWVRETFDNVPVSPGGHFRAGGHWYYKADGDLRPENWRGNGWTPSIHMPKKAARIFLRVETVNIEHLQDIDEEQAKAEGVLPLMMSTDPENTPEEDRSWHEMLSARLRFPEVWGSTMKPADLARYGWSANPWVWVFGFKQITKLEAKEAGWSEDREA